MALGCCNGDNDDGNDNHKDNGNDNNHINYVGGLNLCLKTPNSMQKESTQPDHPALRKCPKCGRILQFCANAEISQYFRTFSPFSFIRAS